MQTWAFGKTSLEIHSYSNKTSNIIHMLQKTFESIMDAPALILKCLFNFRGQMNFWTNSIKDEKMLFQVVKLVI